MPGFLGEWGYFKEEYVDVLQQGQCSTAADYQRAEVWGLIYVRGGKNVSGLLTLQIEGTCMRKRSPEGAETMLCYAWHMSWRFKT